MARTLHVTEAGDFVESDEKSMRDIEDAFLAAGVCHGDIRPRNVLRGSDGRLRLVDFGFSTLVDPSLTHSDSFL